MNIFYTSADPIACAKALDNKRLVKMVLETTQLLSTAINLQGGKTAYKSTHANHPCSIWVRQSQANFHWLLRHLEALSKEYTARYGKVHKCAMYIPTLASQANLMPELPFTSPPNCTIYKEEPDVIKAYNLYMAYKWSNDINPKWSTAYAKD
jgi:hypothetical protein